MDENKLKFGTGLKVWCIFCIIMNALVIFPNILLGYYDLVIIGAIGAFLYIWLLTGKKRLAFYLIAAVTVIIFLINILKYKVGFTSAVGFLNPIITYALLSKYWQEMK